MSDPMTNSEVEDVLSSIRRLVSDEKRSEPDVPEQQKPAAGRLVLTPSLRVLGEEEVPAADPSAPTPETDADHGFVAPFDGEAQHEQDAKTGGAQDLSSSDGHESAPFLLADGFDGSDNLTLQANTAAQFEPVVEYDIVEAVHEDQPEPVNDVVDVPDEEATAQKSDAPETLGAKIAALETLIAGRVDEWEPDQAGTDAYAGTEPPAMDWEDTEDDAHADGAVKEAYQPPEVDDAAPYVDVEAAVFDADASTISTEDDVLDEDALRELVSDIVREELQGALGERITRNVRKLVRKLVRRELHRGLADQDLE